MVKLSELRSADEVKTDALRSPSVQIEYQTQDIESDAIKVYVITEYGYEHFTVLAVYSNEASANDFAKHYKETKGVQCGIEVAEFKLI
jgi:hypothetical protein